MNKVDSILQIIKTLLLIIIFLCVYIVLISIICWAFNIPFTLKTIFGFFAIIAFFKLEVVIYYDREMFG